MGWGHRTTLLRTGGQKGGGTAHENLITCSMFIMGWGHCIKSIWLELDACYNVCILIKYPNADACYLVSCSLAYMGDKTGL